jgi:hypothetical protein
VAGSKPYFSKIRPFHKEIRIEYDRNGHYGKRHEWLVTGVGMDKQEAAWRRSLQKPKDS